MTHCRKPIRSSQIVAFQQTPLTDPSKWWRECRRWQPLFASGPSAQRSVCRARKRLRDSWRRKYKTWSPESGSFKVLSNLICNCLFVKVVHFSSTTNSRGAACDDQSTPSCWREFTDWLAP